MLTHIGFLFPWYIPCSNGVFNWPGLLSHDGSSCDYSYRLLVGAEEETLKLTLSNKGLIFITSSQCIN